MNIQKFEPALVSTFSLPYDGREIKVTTDRKVTVDYLHEITDHIRKMESITITKGESK